MTLETLEGLAPQKTFLLQGSESDFTQLADTIFSKDPFASILTIARFSMDHAHELVQFVSEGTGNTRIYMVFFSLFSPDAAQVLLKSLEEPDMDTLVILVTPYPYIVPATIRSRTMMLSIVDALEEKKYFTRDTLLARIKEEFASDADEDAATRRAKAVGILDVLEAQVRATPLKASIIYNAKHMLFKGNLPTKFVLEYAASMTL